MRQTASRRRQMQTVQRRRSGRWRRAEKRAPGGLSSAGGSAAARTDARSLRRDPARERLDVRAEAGRLPLPCLHARDFRARSRRGWDMTHLLPEFRKSVPAGVQLDGELVASRRTAGPTFTGSARGCCTAAPGSR